MVLMQIATSPIRAVVDRVRAQIAKTVNAWRVGEEALAADWRLVAGKAMAMTMIADHEFATIGCLVVNILTMLRRNLASPDLSTH